MFLMLPIGKERATPQVWARPATAPPALTRRSCEGYGPLRALGVPVTLCLQCRTVVHAAPTVSFLTKMAGLQFPKEPPALEVASPSAFCSSGRVTRPTGASWARVGSVGFQLGPEPTLTGPAPPEPKGSFHRLESRPAEGLQGQPTVTRGNPTRTNARRRAVPFWRSGYECGVSASRAYCVRLTIEQPNAPPGHKRFPTLAQLACNS